MKHLVPSVLCVFVSQVLVAVYHADTSETMYFGLFSKGQLFGYESYSEKDFQYEGSPARLVEDRLEGRITAAGLTYTITSNWTYWLNPEGRPLRATFTRTGADIGMKLEATFGSKTVDLKIDKGGKKWETSLAVPEGFITVDPFTGMIASRPKEIQSPFYYLDGDTMGFVKANVSDVGKSTYIVGGISSQADLIELVLPDSKSRFYYGDSGSLVKLNYGNVDMELLPVSKEVALSKPGPNSASLDVESLIQIRADSPIPSSESLTELKLRISGSDLSQYPSDNGQTVTKDGDGWIVDIHPSRIGLSTVKIEDLQVKGEFERWLKPQDLIPSNSRQFKDLAKKIIANSRSLIEAAVAIRSYVHQTMIPDETKERLESADVLLKTKRGMCGNYAVLTTTLLRAAGIPARFVCGLECIEGVFYYHGWSEIWDGANWLGIDSTVDEPQLSASHFKFAEFPSEDQRNKYMHFGIPQIKVLLAAHY